MTPGPPLAAGLHRVPVEFGGVRHDVRVHVPAERPVRCALVLDLHGSGADGDQQAAISRFDRLAEEAGFVVVQPTAAIPLGSGWAWNVPGVPTTAGELPSADARDDVRFLRTVIDRVGAATGADEDRVYAAGYSGGGRMASALACALSETLAAVGAVAGLRAGRPSPEDVAVPDPAGCSPARPVPVIDLHGDQDRANPYEGNADPRWGYGAPVAVRTWARLNGCRTEPTRERVSEHVSRCSYRDGDGRVVAQHYKVSGGGHTWPGTSADQTGSGHVTHEIDASRVLWEFFAGHRR
jgi:polyhydroxybutyrate depolymerase